MTEQQAQKLLDGLKAAPALMRMKTALDFDQAMRSHDYSRRLALLVLSRPGADLLDNIKANRELAVAMADVLERLRDYGPMLEELRRLVSVAETRIVIALAAREDAVEIVADAKNSRKAKKRRGHRGQVENRL